ncbi:MAG: hypothetical protein ACLTEE_05305 [Anaerobutyricum hallii]
MIIKKIGKLMSTIMAVIMLVTVTVPAFAAEEAETVCKHDQGNYYKYTKHRLVQSQEQEIFFAGYVTSYWKKMNGFLQQDMVF